MKTCPRGYGSGARTSQRDTHTSRAELAVAQVAAKDQSSARNACCGCVVSRLEVHSERRMLLGVVDRGCGVEYFLPGCGDCVRRN
eukprot:347492-Rhodomonas_salina.3